MRLFEAIVSANERALAGDSRAGLRPSEFADSLPVVALTCIDPRLNRLMPEVLGVSEEDFIWLRNAGNIIFDPMSSMMRTLALACALKGGKEIAVIGHTECRVRQVSINQLIESFRALGIPRSSLPDNLTEFFGLFASERQNVINGVGHIRQSPLISPNVPVHGLLVDIYSGRLEWLVNGYDQLGLSRTPVSSPLASPEPADEPIGGIAQAQHAEMRIGALTIEPQEWLAQVQVLNPNVEERGIVSTTGEQTLTPTPEPPRIPIPPPLRLIRSK
jgi:carbonic anhydrase